MVVVVFLLFCGLHNEAGDSKFRKGRQYIAYVGRVGGIEGYKIKPCPNQLCFFTFISWQHDKIGLVNRPGFRKQWCHSSEVRATVEGTAEPTCRVEFTRHITTDRGLLLSEQS